MTRLNTMAAGIAAALTLALAGNALAAPGGYGPGPCATDGTRPGPGAAAGPGYGMGPGQGRKPGWAMGPGGRMGAGFEGRGFGGQLMTLEEMTAHRDKMHNAATPEEHREIAAAHRAEVEKRAKERGINVPEQRGPRGGFGPGYRAAPRTPAVTTE